MTVWLFSLEWGQVDTQRRTVFLGKTKNGDRRQVPLSTVALGALKRYQDEVGDGVRVFPWWNGDQAELNRVTARLSRQFARVFGAAGCPGLRYHDLRHEATCRLYERTRLSDLQVAKITGHKDPRMLAWYANLRASDLADALWFLSLTLSRQVFSDLDRGRSSTLIHRRCCHLRCAANLDRLRQF